MTVEIINVAHPEVTTTIVKGASLAGHGEKFVITHPTPTREQRIAEIDRKIAAGEPLGASHVPMIQPGVYTAGTISMTRKGNPK